MVFDGGDSVIREILHGEGHQTLVDKDGAAVSRNHDTFVGAVCCTRCVVGSVLYKLMVIR